MNFLSKQYIALGIGFFFLMSPSLWAFAEKPKPSLSKSETKKVSKKKAVAKPKSRKDPIYRSKTLKKINRRRAQRERDFYQWKKQGVLGEADNGLLKIKSSSLLKGSELKKMEKRVRDENKDRKKLFKALESQAQYSKAEKIFMRRRSFELNRLGDPKGSYFFQADHWHQN